MQTENRMQLIIDIKKIEQWMVDYSPPKRLQFQEVDSDSYKYKLLVSFGCAVHGKLPNQTFQESKRLWVEDLEEFDHKAQVELLLRSYRGSLEKLGSKGRGFTEYSKLKIGLLEDFCTIHNYSIEKVIRSEILSDDDECVNFGNAARANGKKHIDVRVPRNEDVLGMSEALKKIRIKQKKRRKARLLQRVERQQLQATSLRSRLFSRRNSKPGTPLKSECTKTAKTALTEQVISAKTETTRQKSTQEKCEHLKQLMIDRLEEQVKTIRRMNLLYLSWEDVITYLGTVSKTIMDYQFDD
jgi:hypothetical protein